MLDPNDLKQHGNCPLDRGACAPESMVISYEGCSCTSWCTPTSGPPASPPRRSCLLKARAVALSWLPPPGVPAEANPIHLGPSSRGSSTFPRVVHRCLRRGRLAGRLPAHLQYDPRLFTTLYQRVPTGADADTMDAVFRLRSTARACRPSGRRCSRKTRRTRSVCGSAPGRPRRSMRDRRWQPTASCGTLDTFHSLTVASTTVVGVSSSGILVGLGSWRPDAEIDTLQHPARPEAQSLRSPARILLRRQQRRRWRQMTLRPGFALVGARADLRRGHQPCAVRRLQRLHPDGSRLVGPKVDFRPFRHRRRLGPRHLRFIGRGCEPRGLWLLAIPPAA